MNAPHSGSSYSEDFLASSRLDPRTIRLSEDVFVDDLFSPSTAHGVPLLRANFPRAWLDVNREPFELDQAMFVDALPDHANTRSTRVAGGLGTVPRIVAENEDIYARPLRAAEAMNRIETAYRPYHRALRDLLAGTVRDFGFAVLIDCHSMPSTIRGGYGRFRPDIVLGDRYGAACSGDLTDFCAGVLGRLGYRVTRNKPYAGGFITEYYGRPAEAMHAMQIEVNRCLYMDERRLEKNSGFARLQRDLTVLMAELAEATDSGLLAPAIAAE